MLGKKIGKSELKLNAEAEPRERCARWSSKRRKTSPLRLAPPKSAGRRSASRYPVYALNTKQRSVAISIVDVILTVMVNRHGHGFRIFLFFPTFSVMGILSCEPVCVNIREDGERPPRAGESMAGPGPGGAIGDENLRI